MDVFSATNPLVAAALMLVLSSANAVLVAATKRRSDVVGLYDYGSSSTKLAIGSLAYWFRSAMRSLGAAGIIVIVNRLEHRLSADVCRFIIGMIVFTQVTAIALALNSLRFYRHLDGYPNAAVGKISFQQGVGHLVNANDFGTAFALLSLASVAAPNAFVMGGAFGCLVMAIQYQRLVQDHSLPTAGG